MLADLRANPLALSRQHSPAVFLSLTLTLTLTCHSADPSDFSKSLSNLQLKHNDEGDTEADRQSKEGLYEVHRWASDRSCRRTGLVSQAFPTGCSQGAISDCGKCDNCKRSENVVPSDFTKVLQRVCETCNEAFARQKLKRERMETMVQDELRSDVAGHHAERVAKDLILTLQLYHIIDFQSKKSGRSVVIRSGRNLQKFMRNELPTEFFLQRQKSAGATAAEPVVAAVAEPMQEDDENSREYVVEKIVHRRPARKKATAKPGVAHFEYLVRWDGEAPDKDSWEPHENLVGTSEELLKDYEAMLHRERQSAAATGTDKTQEIKCVPDHLQVMRCIADITLLPAVDSPCTLQETLDGAEFMTRFMVEYYQDSERLKLGVNYADDVSFLQTVLAEGVEGLRRRVGQYMVGKSALPSAEVHYNLAYSVHFELENDEPRWTLDFPTPANRHGMDTEATVKCLPPFPRCSLHSTALARCLSTNDLSGSNFNPR